MSLTAFTGVVDIAVSIAEATDSVPASPSPSAGFTTHLATIPPLSGSPASPSPTTAAGTMIHAARGAVSLPTKSSSEVAPIRPMQLTTSPSRLRSVWCIAA